MKRFKKDKVSKKTKKQFDREGKIAREAGMRGTPHFSVNGEKIVGPQPIEKFRGLIDKHLNK